METRQSNDQRATHLSIMVVTKAEAVYVDLRRRILDGVLSPGTTINQEEMAAQLGLSITPLREALRRLEMEGLVKNLAHRNVEIAPLSMRELRELYAIRCQLDPYAAGLATQLATADELERISQLADEMRSDPRAQLSANRSFHQSIYSACGNSILVGYLDQLWDRTGRYRLIRLQRIMDAPTVKTQHQLIAEACASRDERRTSNLMLRHVTATAKLLEKVLDFT